MEIQLNRQQMKKLYDERLTLQHLYMFTMSGYPMTAMDLADKIGGNPAGIYYFLKRHPGYLKRIIRTQRHSPKQRGRAPYVYYELDKKAIKLVATLQKKNAK